MAKTYRKIQQWNHWLTSFLGRDVLDQERKLLQSLLIEKYCKNALLIGSPYQQDLLQSSNASCQFLLGPLLNRNPEIHYIEGELYELPIQSGSVDQVILPHALEFIDNPHQLLSEACRIVRPEGNIYILGFNPVSLWGLKKCLTNHSHVPWSGNFIQLSTVKKWLALADFELEKQCMILFRPPTQHYELYEKLKCLEWIGKKCYKSFGGVYLLQAKAKVVPLTPIRLHWKQELSGVRVSVGIPGSSIRNHS